MRILYIDIDSLRPDHLGCYGYHRDTSPNIDRIAAQGVRFTNCHASDAPCLPSRSALFSGLFGIHNGAINHGGAAGEPFQDGAQRGFGSRLGSNGWMRCLRNAGFKTATVSPFGERHSAFHWYAGFNEIHNTGKGGMERADEIMPVALDWLKRNGADDHWFLHVNLWDPHTPYRSPQEFVCPFANEPLPAWLTEEVRQRHWRGCGPHSAQELQGFDRVDHFQGRYPQQPMVVDSMAEVRRMFDGYDAGVRYADEAVGRLLKVLGDLRVIEDTVIIISSDHGENLGELNVYGDHQLADQITTRIPLIVAHPAWTSAQRGRADQALHYHMDFAATLVEMVGGRVPSDWDGRSFAPAFRQGREAGRDFLVVSQGAWSCQRAVRFEDHLCIRSYHDGYHGFPDLMLFNVKDDPHEQHDLAPARPDLVQKAMSLLETWHAGMMRTAAHPRDPMMTVLREGGSAHTRNQLPKYLERLRATGRADRADDLAKAHPGEAAETSPSA